MSDIIVWGATGFTGRLVCEYLAENYGTIPSDFTWSAAGRSLSRVTAAVAHLPSLSRNSKVLPVSVRDAAAPVPTRSADLSDPASIDAMLKGAKVCITTVGPYSLHGDPLVLSCVRMGVHVVDLTGETPWVSHLVDDVHADAVAAGVKVVNSCGFDSVPSEMAAAMVAAHAGAGDPIREVKACVGKIKGGVSGGTVASALAVIESGSGSKARGPYSLVRDESRKGGRDGADQALVRWDSDFQVWTVPFIMAPVNMRAVRRTNSLRDRPYGPTFKYAEFAAARSLLAAILTWLALAALVIAMALRPTRWLLRKFVLPNQGQGPSPEAMRAGHFSIHVVGKTESGRVIRGKITGDRDPGYSMTARMITESALAILRGENDGGCSLKGGVLTPASAIGSPLMSRLSKVGMSFEIISDRTKAEDTEHITTSGESIVFGRSKSKSN